MSLTSLSSKVMEHIVSWHISRHLSTNRIISQHQHGFRRGLSCETTHHCRLRMGISLEHPRSNRCYILDFAKAFDSVPHEQLLLKADYYWIANIWLWSFPTERTASGRVVSRVPQGTVLGPILFLKLINDLPTKITSSIKLFADDCVPYRPINSAGEQFAL